MTSEQVLAPSSQKQKTTKPPVLRIASWNICTMCPGLSTDPQLMDDSCKTAIINKELARLIIDIACLQETQLAESGSLMRRGHTFFCQGLSQDEPRQYGVGFAVRNSLIATTESPSGGLSRILALRMKTSPGFVNIMSAYAPTLTSTPEAKDQFYEALQEALSGIPSSEGILYARRFQRSRWDRLASMAYLPRPLVATWPLGVGRMNENGLLELCITKSYYRSKELHKVSWRHPRSSHTSAVSFTQEAITVLTVTRTTRSLQAGSG